MVAVRQTTVVVPPTRDGSGEFYPSMSPSVCVLGNGDVLVSTTMGSKAVGAVERATVWLYGPDLTLKDTYEYVGSGQYRDTQLTATGDARALLLVSNFAASGAEDAVAIVLDCAGGSVTAQAVVASPVVDDFTGGFLKFSRYVESTGLVIVFGAKYVAVYHADTGACATTYAFPLAERQRWHFGHHINPDNPSAFTVLATGRVTRTPTRTT
jgi:hypothetical protein